MEGSRSYPFHFSLIYIKDQIFLEITTPENMLKATIIKKNSNIIINDDCGKPSASMPLDLPNFIFIFFISFISNIVFTINSFVLKK